jgi:GNAT superfamily N-acetyltransferase
MRKVRTFSTPRRLEYAKHICIIHKLYVEGWSFLHWLKRANITLIGIVYDGDVPVGCFIKKQDGWPNCGVFIKPEYRLKGYGKMLLSTIYRRFPDENFRTGYGIEGSRTFFDKCALTKAE